MSLQYQQVFLCKCTSSKYFLTCWSVVSIDWSRVYKNIKNSCPDCTSCGFWRDCSYRILFNHLFSRSLLLLYRFFSIASYLFWKWWMAPFASPHTSVLKYCIFSAFGIVLFAWTIFMNRSWNVGQSSHFLSSVSNCILGNFKLLILAPGSVSIRQHNCYITVSYLISRLCTAMLDTCSNVFSLEIPYECCLIFYWSILHRIFYLLATSGSVNSFWPLVPDT